MLSATKQLRSVVMPSCLEDKLQIIPFYVQKANSLEILLHLMIFFSGLT